MNNEMWAVAQRPFYPVRKVFKGTDMLRPEALRAAHPSMEFIRVPLAGPSRVEWMFKHADALREFNKWARTARDRTFDARTRTGDERP